MEHSSYSALLRLLASRRSDARAPHPIALVLADIPEGCDHTVRHCLKSGFETVVVLGRRTDPLPNDWNNTVHCAPFDVQRQGAFPAATNALIGAMPGHWLHTCYGGEYLFWPFGDDRSVRDLTLFAQEERRNSVSGLIVDIYADSADRPPNAGVGADCWFDHDGYVADPVAGADGIALARQLAVRGGLRLRLAHILRAPERIDRVLLFRARRGLEMRPDLSFNFEEYNTRACPWHRSVTGVLCSDRAARALARHPDRARAPTRLVWRGASRFDWSARQLMASGLMEPGQWV